MLPIYICDDNLIHKKYIESIVKDYIAKSNRPMEIVLSTHNPIELLEYLVVHSSEKGLFLLDVDLQHELNGIILASKIRESDHSSKIVFITSHDELSHLTFRYHIEALDYIIKDTENFKERIGSCLDLAYSNYQNRTLETDFYELQSVKGIRKIPFEEIMFFETHSRDHRLIIHLKNGRVEFNSTLSNVEKQIQSGFFRSHKSYFVNINNIRQVDKLERTVEMANGELALLSRNKIKELLEILSQL
jgi:two-component system response regulator AgrA